MELPLLTRGLVFLSGLVVGSFLNVCIWRLPAGEQVIRGRSHCRGCGHLIAWYDNLPLLSFLILKGRCRFCRARISWVYPAVELATGALFLLVFQRFGLTAAGLTYAALGAALILISAIDARCMEIPDEVTYPGMQLGVILSFFTPELHGASSRWGGLISSLLGALAGAGFLWVIGTVGSWVFKREAMGGGDVKLMAMVGSLLGAGKTLLVNLGFAPVLGSIVGLVLKYRYGKELIPYGPFLAAGTLMAVFWGDGILQWYRKILLGI
ncbi:MAG: prepilin peptidase [Candidatus Omnitrophica bacterium]|nr:prepilin peptidase [Candidatus Omnitrophota bacterium]